MLMKEQTSVYEAFIDAYNLSNRSLKRHFESLDKTLEKYSKFINKTENFEVSIFKLDEEILVVSEIFSTFILINEKFSFNLNNSSKLFCVQNMVNCTPLL